MQHDLFGDAAEPDVAMMQEGLEPRGREEDLPRRLGGGDARRAHEELLGYGDGDDGQGDEGAAGHDSGGSDGGEEGEEEDYEEDEDEEDEEESNSATLSDEECDDVAVLGAGPTRRAAASARRDPEAEQWDMLDAQQQRAQHGRRRSDAGSEAMHGVDGFASSENGSVASALALGRRVRGASTSNEAAMRAQAAARHDPMYPKFDAMSGEAWRRMSEIGHEYTVSQSPDNRRSAQESYVSACRMLDEATHNDPRFAFNDQWIADPLQDKERYESARSAILDKIAAEVRVEAEKEADKEVRHAISCNEVMCLNIPLWKLHSQGQTMDDVAKAVPPRLASTKAQEELANASIKASAAILGLVECQHAMGIAMGDAIKPEVASDEEDGSDDDVSVNSNGRRSGQKRGRNKEAAAPVRREYVFRSKNREDCTVFMRHCGIELIYGEDRNRDSTSRSRAHSREDTGDGSIVCEGAELSSQRTIDSHYTPRLDARVHHVVRCYTDALLKALISKGKAIKDAASLESVCPTEPCARNAQGVRPVPCEAIPLLDEIEQSLATEWHVAASVLEGGVRAAVERRSIDPSVTVHHIYETPEERRERMGREEARRQAVDGDDAHRINMLAAIASSGLDEIGAGGDEDEDEDEDEDKGEGEGEGEDADGDDHDSDRRGARAPLAQRTAHEQRIINTCATVYADAALRAANPVAVAAAQWDASKAVEKACLRRASTHVLGLLEKVRELVLSYRHQLASCVVQSHLAARALCARICDAVAHTAALYWEDVVAEAVVDDALELVRQLKIHAIDDASPPPSAMAMVDDDDVDLFGDDDDDTPSPMSIAPVVREMGPVSIPITGCDDSYALYANHRELAEELDPQLVRQREALFAACQRIVSDFAAAAPSPAGRSPELDAIVLRKDANSGAYLDAQGSAHSLNLLSFDSSVRRWKAQTKHVAEMGTRALKHDVVLAIAAHLAPGEYDQRLATRKASIMDALVEVRIARCIRDESTNVFSAYSTRGLGTRGAQAGYQPVAVRVWWLVLDPKYDCNRGWERLMRANALAASSAGADGKAARARKKPAVEASTKTNAMRSCENIVSESALYHALQMHCSQVASSTGAGDYYNTPTFMTDKGRALMPFNSHTHAGALARHPMSCSQTLGVCSITWQTKPMSLVMGLRWPDGTQMIVDEKHLFASNYVTREEQAPPGQKLVFCPTSSIANDSLYMLNGSLDLLSTPLPAQYSESRAAPMDIISASVSCRVRDDPSGFGVEVSKSPLAYEHGTSKRSFASLLEGDETTWFANSREVGSYLTMERMVNAGRSASQQLGSLRTRLRRQHDAANGPRTHTQHVRTRRPQRELRERLQRVHADLTRFCAHQEERLAKYNAAIHAMIAAKRGAAAIEARVAHFREKTLWYHQRRSAMWDAYFRFGIAEVEDMLENDNEDLPTGLVRRASEAVKHIQTLPSRSPVASAVLETNDKLSTYGNMLEIECRFAHCILECASFRSWMLVYLKSFDAVADMKQKFVVAVIGNAGGGKSTFMEMLEKTTLPGTVQMQGSTSDVAEKNGASDVSGSVAYFDEKPRWMNPGHEQINDRKMMITECQIVHIRTARELNDEGVEQFVRQVITTEHTEQIMCCMNTGPALGANENQFYNDNEHYALCDRVIPLFLRNMDHHDGDPKFVGNLANPVNAKAFAEHRTRESLTTLLMVVRNCVPGFDVELDHVKTTFEAIDGELLRSSDIAKPTSREQLVRYALLRSTSLMHAGHVVFNQYETQRLHAPQLWPHGATAPAAFTMAQLRFCLPVLKVPTSEMALSALFLERFSSRSCDPLIDQVLNAVVRNMNLRPSHLHAMPHTGTGVQSGLEALQSDNEDSLAECALRERGTRLHADTMYDCVQSNLSGLAVNQKLSQPDARPVLPAPAGGEVAFERGVHLMHARGEALDRASDELQHRRAAMEAGLAITREARSQLTHDGPKRFENNPREVARLLPSLQEMLTFVQDSVLCTAVVNHAQVPRSAEMFQVPTTNMTNALDYNPSLFSYFPRDEGSGSNAPAGGAGDAARARPAAQAGAIGAAGATGDAGGGNGDAAAQSTASAAVGARCRGEAISGVDYAWMPFNMSNGATRTLPAKATCVDYGHLLAGQSGTSLHTLKMAPVVVIDALRLLTKRELMHRDSRAGRGIVKLRASSDAIDKTVDSIDLESMVMCYTMSTRDMSARLESWAARMARLALLRGAFKQCHLELGTGDVMRSPVARMQTRVDSRTNDERTQLAFNTIAIRRHMEWAAEADLIMRRLPGVGSFKDTLLEQAEQAQSDGPSNNVRSAPDMPKYWDAILLARLVTAVKEVFWHREYDAKKERLGKGGVQSELLSSHIALPTHAPALSFTEKAAREAGGNTKVDATVITIDPIEWQRNASSLRHREQRVRAALDVSRHEVQQSFGNGAHLAVGDELFGDRLFPSSGRRAWSMRASDRGPDDDEADGANPFTTTELFGMQASRKKLTDPWFNAVGLALSTYGLNCGGATGRVLKMARTSGPINRRTNLLAALAAADEEAMRRVARARERATEGEPSSSEYSAVDLSFALAGGMGDEDDM